MSHHLDTIEAAPSPVPTSIGDINTGIHIYATPMDVAAVLDGEGEEITPATTERGAGSINFQVRDADGNNMDVGDQNRIDVRDAPTAVKVKIFEAEALLRTWIAELTDLDEGR